MCCIFTCCGWMVDLIQRLWTFTMSCFISSAVCCSLVTASMSGVALGYNYSLAEYIDLKETNVSVYLKRGIFDDEIADDMEWRRRGHQPVAGHIGENNLLTASDDSSTTLRSGRRLDDSIYESNDRNNFEGSLMRLTARAPDHSIITTTDGGPIHEIIRQYPPGSVDVLKAVQGVINSKKAEAAARRWSKEKQEQSSSNVNSMLKSNSNDPRRVMKFDVPPYEAPSTPNSLRLAVPEDSINELSKLRSLKRPSISTPINVYYTDSVFAYTYPSLATPRPGPVRPTKSKLTQRTRPSPSRKSHTPSRTVEPKLPKSIDEEMESFKEKLMDDKFDEPGANDDEFLRKIKTGLRKPSDDYDDQIKGLPLRKRRHINISAFAKKADTNNEIIKNNLNRESTVNSEIVNLLKKTTFGASLIFSDASFTDSSSNKIEKNHNEKVYSKPSQRLSSNKLFRLGISTLIA